MTLTTRLLGLAFASADTLVEVDPKGIVAFAIGAGAERFHGRIDNTEIPKIVARLAGYKLPAGL